MILFLLACGSPECEGPTSSGDPDFALTVADPRFGAGGLAFGDDAGASCPHLGTTADAILRVIEDRLYVLDRGGVDVVTAVDLPSGELAWQTALDPGANPHDLVALDGRLYVPQYGDGRIAVLDESSGEHLDPLEPPDATHLDAAFVRDGVLWVADHRFDAAFEQSEGVLVALEPDGSVVHTVEAGANPRVFDLGDRVAVATGLLAVRPDQTARLEDGEVRMFDPADMRFSDPVLSEAQLHADVHEVVAVDGHLVATVVDAQLDSSLVCDGEPGPSDAAWFVAMAARGDDVLVASRSSLSPEGLEGRGLFTLDPATCSIDSTLTLPAVEPYDVVAW